MKRLKHIVCVLLSVITVSLCLNPLAAAEKQVRKGYINASNVNVRKEPNTDSEIIAQISFQKVTINFDTGKNEEESSKDNSSGTETESSKPSSSSSKDKDSSKTSSSSKNSKVSNTSKTESGEENKKSAAYSKNQSTKEESKTSSSSKESSKTSSSSSKDSSKTSSSSSKDKENSKTSSGSSKDKESSKTSSSSKTESDKQSSSASESQEVKAEQDIWYNITTEDGITGYVFGEYITLIPNDVYDADFEKNLANFPESFHQALRDIHAVYPNWKFVANYIDLTFEEAVSIQYGTEYRYNRKLFPVKYLDFGDEWRDERAYDAVNGRWIECEANWTYASRYAIGHYMNVNNFLSPGSIFMFMSQSYNPQNETKKIVKQVIKGTFLAEGYDGDKNAYLNDIMAAAEESGVSPSVIAAMIIIEQGTQGTSPIISGTYPGYEGYYNFFNYRAYGESPEIIYNNGLSYAVEQGWNSRRAAIVGAAKIYEDGYISEGQDTFFYMNYNIINKRFNHQYAGNVRDAEGKATYLRKAFIENYNATIEFKLPIYADWPVAEPAPDTENETPENTVPEVVVPEVPKGDINFDSTIDAVDLAAAKLHILGVQPLTGDALTASDINKDGVTDAVDLAALKLHILGITSIN